MILLNWVLMSLLLRKLLGRVGVLLLSVKEMEIRRLFFGSLFRVKELLL